MYQILSSKRLSNIIFNYKIYTVFINFYIFLGEVNRIFWKNQFVITKNKNQNVIDNDNRLKILFSNKIIYN